MASHTPTRSPTSVPVFSSWNAAALLVEGYPAAARQATLEAPRPRAATFGDLARADPLHEVASRLELGDTPDDKLAAASHYVRSAQLRPLGDDRTYRSLFRAAQLLRGVGRTEAALTTLEQSAAHARLYANIEREAEALLSAGWLAHQCGDLAAMDRLLSRAYLLRYAPLLPEVTRDEVLRRVLLPTGTDGRFRIADSGAGQGPGV